MHLDVGAVCVLSNIPMIRTDSLASVRWVQGGLKVGRASRMEVGKRSAARVQGLYRGTVCGRLVCVLCEFLCVGASSTLFSFEACRAR